MEIYKRFKLKISLVIIFVLASALVFSGFSGCRKDGLRPIQLTVWNVSGDTKSWESMISSYEASVKADKTVAQVKITYVEKKFENNKDYEDEISKALSEGTAPDIITLNNSWISRYKNKIYPMDRGGAMAQDFKNKYVDVVSDDFLEGTKVYGIPLSMDTLALYYNEDLLNNARVFDPPKTWDELGEAVKKITKSDEKGTITRAGIAMGTDKNVDRSSDILSLLMLQGGSTITDETQKIATFSEIIKDNSDTNQDQRKTIGGVALQLYTDFANPVKPVYTWNPLLNYSIDAFSKGEVAMMINYAYNIPAVVAKNPKLRFKVAPVPQHTGVTVPVNYANYWAMTVLSGSTHPTEAWDFLISINKAEANKVYLTATAKPAAQRDLIAWQENGDDLKLGVFARQGLTAKSWYQKDNYAIETIFNDAINSVVLGRSTPESASILAASQMNQIMKK